MSLNHRRPEAPLPNPLFTPKPQKQWSITRGVEYLFREQRVLFVLIGMAMASTLFYLQPNFLFSPAHNVHTSSSYELAPYDVEQDVPLPDAFETAPYKIQRSAIISPGGKIPLGLPSKGLRVVVTGGAGFVGSHLVDKLIARGDSVIVVDNFFTGRKENVMHHFGNPRFELIRHDVVEPLLLEVDHIYHLACPASPVHYKFNPVKTIISSPVCKWSLPCLLTAM